MIVLWFPYSLLGYYKTKCHCGYICMEVVPVIILLKVNLYWTQNLWSFKGVHNIWYKWPLRLAKLGLQTKDKALETDEQHPARH